MSEQTLSPALSEPEPWMYRWELHPEDRVWDDRQLGVVYADAYRDALIAAGRVAVGPAEWSREYAPAGLCLVARTQTCRILTASAERRAAA